MPNGEQLTPKEFAAKVKAKYPVYSSVPDEQLVDKIVSKYPQYKSQIKFVPAMPDIGKQITEKLRSTPMERSFWGGAYPSKQEEAEITKHLPEVQPLAHEFRQGALETAGAMFGGTYGRALVPGAKAAAGGSKFLQWLLPLLARASSTGAGAGAGTLVSGGSPKEALSTAATFTGAEAGGEGLGKVAEKTSKPIARFIKDVTKSKAKLLEEQAAVESAEAEKAYQKKLAAHQERVQKVKEDYAVKVREHSEAAKTASTKQSAAEAKTGAALGHQNELAGLLKESLELANHKISSELGKEFEAVSDTVQAKNPRVKVSDVEREARGKLYFPDSVSAFNNIMENVSGKLKMSDYSILRKTYASLNDVLYGGGDMPDDLYAAVKTVRDSLGKDLQGAANQVGLGGKYGKAMRDWSDYKDTWSSKASIAKGGSPIKKILDAEDPAFVIDQLKGKAGERLLEDIGKYQKYGADKALAGRLKGFIEQVKAMPSSAGEIPSAPKRPEFPKAPERPEAKPFDRDAAARQILIDRIRKGAGIGGGVLAGEALYKLISNMFGGGSEHRPPM